MRPRIVFAHHALPTIPQAHIPAPVVVHQGGVPGYIVTHAKTLVPDVLVAVLMGLAALVNIIHSIHTISFESTMIAMKGESIVLLSCASQACGDHGVEGAVVEANPLINKEVGIVMLVAPVSRAHAVLCVLLLLCEADAVLLLFLRHKEAGGRGALHLATWYKVPHS